MSYIADLASELTTDPLTRGYVGMTDQQATDDLNTVYRTRNRPTMEAWEVFNAIVKAEFNALSAGDQQRVWDILHLGTVNPFGLEADLFIDLFGGGSGTITALADLRKEDISRAEELFGRRVLVGHVTSARAL